jgi:hypothetical protein
VAFTFGHDGVLEAGAKVIGEFVDLVVAVNFDGFLGGIHDHVALAAPMEVFVQFSFQALTKGPIQVVG